ncbi:phosphoribosylanthranilate isomerase [Tamilnaduibacter salinus]|uniref:N-(5'-phosphoribosyl)anthranilate isomerase n=1 Tax=Tamilnaduibacter salinus TaxID=1484056 RepID=A0A2U1CZV8_9GAMM|nr:phosphoribosylanthranilate isomerase [Tamilnaduibacter salinus]PVY78241.1 phosphoribosylanthranilate isomerase [Tamilnaduibacter salinus]
MPSTRVKICGVTRPEDARAAARAGADAIGLVFYEPSPRAVTLEQARAVVAATPAFVTVTGLFVNPTESEVRETLASVPLDLLQFHGDESPSFCDQFRRRWMKAIRMRDSTDLGSAFRQYAGGSGMLVDAYSPERYGGTGETFDWSLIPPERPMPVILAGGLTSANVAAAIARVAPWGVDVSGGVERDKGIKDPKRVVDFINEVNRVGKTDRSNAQ